MKIGHIAALAAAGLILAGCERKSSNTDNPEVPVTRMFEFGGCTVYRFVDAGRYIYYSNCHGTAQSFDDEGCGKGCDIPVTVQTTRIPE